MLLPGESIPTLIQQLRVDYRAMTLMQQQARLILLAMLFLIIVSGWASAQGPIAYWPFNGNANDQTGNGHNGTVSGATGTADRFGNANSAYLFNGITDYIQVPDAPDLRFPVTQEFTFSFWAKSCAIPLTRWIAYIDKGPFLTGEYHVELYFNNGERVELNTTLHLHASCVTSVNDGKWHNITVTFNTPQSPSSPHREIWIDGVLCPGGNIGDVDWAFLYTTNTDPVYFGHGTFPAGYFKGALDDIRMYDRVLSASEILALYSMNGWPNGVIQRVGGDLTPATTTIICPGDSVQLSLKTTGAVGRVVWVNTEGLGVPRGMRASDTNKLTLWVRPLDTIVYRAYIYGSEPCPDDSNAVEVKILVRKGPLLPHVSYRYICAGDSAEIGEEATGTTQPFTYQWDAAPDIANRNKPTQRVAPKVTTTYYLHASDINGCRAHDTVKVIVIGRPVLGGLIRTVYICRGTGDTIGVDATGGNGRYRYKWTPSTGLSSDTVARPLANPSATTRYTIVVTDVALGCTTRDSVDVVLHERPTADAGVDIVLCPDTSTVLGDIPAAAGLQYAWSPAAGLDDSSLARPTARPLQTTTYRLTVTDVLSRCSATDDITVTVPDGVITPSRDTIDFGVLDGCTPSKASTFSLTNTGTTNLTIGAVDISLIGTALVSPALPFVLKPGESVPVVIRFAPGVGGVFSGALILHGSPCNLTRRITLRGSKLDLHVATNPSSVDFGVTSACSSIVRDTIILITNEGTAPLDLGMPQIVAPFSIISPTFPTTVSPGDTLQLHLRYVAIAGTHSSDLVLPYSSSTCSDTFRIKLAAVHELPELASEPPTIMIELKGCATSFDTTITLRNIGAIPLLIDSVTFPAGWQAVGIIRAPILPGDVQRATFRFKPGADGTFIGQMHMYISPCNQDVTIELRGVKSGPTFSMPDTIDFGEVIFCGDSTVEQSVEILYKGDSLVNGEVAAVTVGAPFSTTILPGATLQPGVPRSFIVGVTPTVDGPFSGSITVRFDPCGRDRTLFVRGIRRTAQLTAIPPLVDFGIVPRGTTVTREVSYVNTGPVPVTVDRVNGIVPPFTLAGTIPPLPALLAPGDTLHLQVDAVNRPGRTEIVAEAVTDLPCHLSAGATIRAQGGRLDSVTVSLPTISAAPGDKFLLTLRLESGGRGLDSFGLRRFEAVIGFNTTMLVASDRSLQTNDATTSHVRITGERHDTVGVLAEIEMLAALGNAETTSLVIESFRWLDPIDPLDSVVMRLDSGLFHTDGLCLVGTTRLVSGNGDLFMRPVQPNPARRMITIEYGLAEDGPTELLVIDMQGRRVATLLQGERRHGTYSATLDVGSIGSGRYLIVLRTPTAMLTREMEVVR